MVVMSKFKIKQKKCEDKIAHKRAIKEEEKVEAAKNHKLMADNSSKLVQCLEASLARDETIVNEKNIQLIDHKIDYEFGTVDCKLGEMDN
jgi:hypothetical protein